MILGIFESWAQLLEVVGVWLAAIATFAAAYIALRVAAQSSSQFVKVNARPMIEYSRGVGGSQNDVFLVSATNCGMRDVTITHLAVKCRYPRYNAVLMEGLQGSSPIPVTLADGASASWRYPELATNGESWYRGFAFHFKEYNLFQLWFILLGMRFFVITSLGNEFFAPRSKEFRKKVQQQILEVQKIK